MVSGPQTLEPSNPEGNWGIRAPDGRIVYRFISHNTGTLIDRLRAYADAVGQDYSNYSIDRVDPTSSRTPVQDIGMDIAQNFIPGSTMDLQQQRQAAAPQPTGG
jgi:hypothetical protein